MHSQMFLQNQASAMHRLQAFACLCAATIISAQISECLFALENSGRSRAFRLGPISGYIGAVATLRQADFNGAGGVALPLRPEKGEPFQSRMRRRFRPSLNQPRAH